VFVTKYLSAKLKKKLGYPGQKLKKIFNAKIQDFSMFNFFTQELVICPNN